MMCVYGDQQIILTRMVVLIHAALFLLVLVMFRRVSNQTDTLELLGLREPFNKLRGKSVTLPFPILYSTLYLVLVMEQGQESLKGRIYLTESALCHHEVLFSSLQSFPQKYFTLLYLCTTLLVQEVSNQKNQKYNMKKHSISDGIMDRNN